MTNAELADILNEIDELKAKLYGRKFDLPKGSGRTEPCKAPGKCCVCDKEFQPWNLIRRNCKVKQTEKGPIVVGSKVCYRCCPHIKDWQLERYEINIDFWPEQWKMYLDSGVYGKKRAYKQGAWDDSKEK